MFRKYICIFLCVCCKFSCLGNPGEMVSVNRRQTVEYLPMLDESSWSHDSERMFCGHNLATVVYNHTSCTHSVDDKTVFAFEFDRLVQNFNVFFEFCKYFGNFFLFFYNLEQNIQHSKQHVLIKLPLYISNGIIDVAGKSDENYINNLLRNFRKHFRINLDFLDQTYNATNIITVNKHYVDQYDSCDISFSHWVDKKLKNDHDELINLDIRSTVFVNCHLLDCDSLIDNIINYFIQFKLLNQKLVLSDNDKEFAVLCNSRLNIVANLNLHVDNLLLKLGDDGANFMCGIYLYSRKNVAYKMYFANRNDKATTIKDISLSCRAD